MKKAIYFESLANLKVKCTLCPRYCVLSPDDIGFCRSRKNINGTLFATNYAESVTISTDPIEKKPLYHYFPRIDILSLGSNSCNLACDFCQNYSISQINSRTVKILPEDLRNLCIKYKVDHVSFTYTEPITWYEYVLDSAQILKKDKIGIVLVSNGFINRDPLDKLLPYIDAMNIDLKAMSEDFYKKYCQASLQPVLDTIQTAAATCHVEITNLLISGLNDNDEQIDSLIDFVSNVNPDIPLHFSRYFPQYKRIDPPTSQKTMFMAYKKAIRKLSHVYLGNMICDREANTYCPECNSLLVSRRGYNVRIENFNKGYCLICNRKIYGRFV